MPWCQANLSDGWGVLPRTGCLTASVGGNDGGGIVGEQLSFVPGEGEGGFLADSFVPDQVFGEFVEGFEGRGELGAVVVRVDFLDLVLKLSGTGLVRLDGSSLALRALPARVRAGP